MAPSNSRNGEVTGFFIMGDTSSTKPLIHLPSRPPRSRHRMNEKIYQKYDGSQVTETMLQEASELFNNNYGVWGKGAAVMGAFANEGKRVRMGKERLRAQCVPVDASSSYVRVIVDGHLAGNVFACRWKHDNKTICWISQLVVHREYRERGLAAGLLNEVREEQDSVYGLMSSHAAACIAAARAFGSTISAVQLDFIRDHAEGMMRTSPVNYVRDARLRGSLFKEDEVEGMISSVDTRFFVDHTEPLEALASAREYIDWPLGDLHDGHEFLLIVEARPRPRSRSQSRFAS